MSSSSSNKQIVLPPLNGSLSLPKIAAATTHTIDRHLARIVAGNAGLCVSRVCFFIVTIKEKLLENLRAHLDSMYKLLRPDDRLTLVCFINIFLFSLIFFNRWSNWKVVFQIVFDT
jgi:hypothetical protein